MKSKYPAKIVKGSFKVNINHRTDGMFSVEYSVKGKRKRHTRTDEESAWTLAREKLIELHNGQFEEFVSAKAKTELIRAKQTLLDAGLCLTVDEACSDYASACRLIRDYNVDVTVSAVGSN